MVQLDTGVEYSMTLKMCQYTLSTYTGVVLRLILAGWEIGMQDKRKLQSVLA